MRRKLFLLSALILTGLFLFSLKTEAQPITEESTTYFSAEVVLPDDNQPTAPVLHSPADKSVLYQQTPVFTWYESQDDQKVLGYFFHLSSQAGESVYNFQKNITDPETNSDYRVWYENGLWYLQLLSPLPWDQYHWEVTAYDYSYQVKSQTWSLTLQKREPPTNKDTTTPGLTFDCQKDSLIGKIHLLSPKDSLSTAKPALVFSFPQGAKPLKADIYLNEQLIFAQVSLVASYQNSSYLVNLDQGQERIIIQPLHEFIDLSQENQIKVIFTDTDNCQTALTGGLLLTDGSQPEQTVIIPQLISPQHNSVGSDRITNFSWKINSPLSHLQKQVFFLNNRGLFTLGPNSQDNDDYTYQIEDFGHYVQFLLKLKKNQYQLEDELFLFQPNDPSNPQDYYSWSITALGKNNYQTKSSTWRFRFFPKLTGQYAWCTDKQSCTSGTLADCLKSGKNCYYQDQNLCLTQAKVDCGDKPPQKTYYWCDNQERCLAGTLQTCAQSGRNCYIGDLYQECQKNAAQECGDEGQYFWCHSNLTCQTGSLQECANSGKDCYKQNSPRQTCPAEVRTHCQPVGGPLTKTFWGQFISLPFNLFDWWQNLGLSWSQVQALEEFLARNMPFVSLAIFLPLALLFIFFPRPKGLVFNQKNRQGCQGSLVIVQKDGQFYQASLTDKYGFYDGFRLPKGKYQLIVAHPYLIFPSQTKELRKNQKYFYQGEVFQSRSQFFSFITYQIPLDLPKEQKAKALAKKFLTQDLFGWRLLLSKIANSLYFCWPLAFLLHLFLTLLYPSLLNFIILAIFVLGGLARLLAKIKKFNFSTFVFDHKGKALGSFPLDFYFAANKKLIMRTKTDQKGFLKILLHPKFTYFLQSEGANFIEEDGKTAKVEFSFAQESQQNLVLVAKKKK